MDLGRCRPRRRCRSYGLSMIITILLIFSVDTLEEEKKKNGWPNVMVFLPCHALSTAAFVPRSTLSFWVPSSRKKAYRKLQPVFLSMTPRHMETDDNDERKQQQQQQQPLLGQLQQALEPCGLWNNATGFDNLQRMAVDFRSRPEVLSSVLISDFGLDPFIAHQARAYIMNHLSASSLSLDQNVKQQNDYNIEKDSDPNHSPKTNIISTTIAMNEEHAMSENATNSKNTTATIVKKRMKQIIVNSRAAQRRRRPLSPKLSSASSQNSNITTNSDSYEYGLPSNYQELYPTLAQELEAFERFMIQPTTMSMEDPIRPATAHVYLRHVRQFLGWCLYTNKDSNNSNNNDKKWISILDIIPSSDKESATPIIDFVLWLRSSRQISASYEANILRGMIKFLKFRFAYQNNNENEESSFKETNGNHNDYDRALSSFYDSNVNNNNNNKMKKKNGFSKTISNNDMIPVIQEVRQLHRVANQRARLAPRSSDERHKWISWPEYLQVVQKTFQDLQMQMEDYQQEKSITLESSKSTKTKTRNKTNQNNQELLKEKDMKWRIRIADAYQRYLILAIFTNIPDRQRTIRELEIGRTLLKDDDVEFENCCWYIKHGPEDYKTGKAYGDRPPLPLPSELSSHIDDFIRHWRPALFFYHQKKTKDEEQQFNDLPIPHHDMLFVQSRTGNPMSQDSIYQRVSRACFQYTGKRTNPHLLRDMIVTHVRGSSDGVVSETDLEALALFMGHSIQMQRSTYDRRTLATKMAPAVKLLQTVNNNNINKKS